MGKKLHHKITINRVTTENEFYKYTFAILYALSMDVIKTFNLLATLSSSAVSNQVLSFPLLEFCFLRWDAIIISISISFLKFWFDSLFFQYQQSSATIFIDENYFPV